MDRLKSIRDSCIAELKTLSGLVAGPSVARLINQEAEEGDCFKLGDVYAHCFYFCITPTYGLKIPRETEPAGDPDAWPADTWPGWQNGESIILPGYSADPDNIRTLFDDLKLYPRPTEEQIKSYADMADEALCDALIDIITDAGEGSTDADAILWRCVYAGYICLQAIQRAKNTPKPRRRADKDLIARSLSGGRQLSITNKKYQGALLPKPNKTAYVEIFDGSLFDYLRFNDKGMLEIGPDTEQRLARANRQSNSLEKYSVNLIQQVFTAVFRAQVAVTEQTVTIHIPTFCSEMGMDIQSGKANDIFSKLRVFENCMGVLGGDKYYALLKIIEIDQTANTMTFAAPYINKLLIQIAKDPTMRKKGKTYEYTIPGYCWLIHAAITSARNEPAKQIVNYLIAGLMQRGRKSDTALKQKQGKTEKEAGKVTFAVTFKTIIEQAPILQQRLLTGTTADKNKKLKRAFLGAYDLLKTRTDVYQYFINLTVPQIFPTVTTLEKKLSITHQGINPNYKKPF